MPHRNFIKSVGKAAAILEAIRDFDQPASLEEITRSSKLTKTTCFRLLQTMLELKLAAQDGSSKNYRLGPKLISLGLSALDSFDLHKEAVPWMKKLREDTGETVNLSILDGDELLIIERFRSGHLYSANLTVGSRLPVHCTSQGKAILAFIDKGKREKILSRIKLKKYTHKTVGNKNELRKQLLQIRKTGYSVNFEEFEIGIAAVAGPIINHNGDAVASLNVSFPLARHPDERFIRELSRRVVETCQKLSVAQGYAERSHNFSN